MRGLAKTPRAMGLRVVTLVPDLGPWKEQLTFSKGWALTSIETEEVEGGDPQTLSLAPADPCCS